MLALKSASVTDINTGEITTTYSLDGEPCPTVILKGGLATKVAAITAILADLRDAKMWLEEVHRIIGPTTPRELGAQHFSTNELQLPIQVRPMWLAAVMAYMKCFTENQGRNCSMSFMELEEKFHATHKLIQGVRNQYVAHAGKSAHERYHSFLILNPDDTSGECQISHHVARTEFSDDRNDEVPFLDLIEEASRVATKMGHKAYTRLKEEILKRPTSDWYQEAGPLRF